MSQENVFKVCDQPHPLLIARIVENCMAAKLDEAYSGMRVSAWAGYIISSSMLLSMLALGRVPGYMRLAHPVTLAWQLSP